MPSRSLDRSPRPSRRRTTSASSTGTSTYELLVYDLARESLSRLTTEESSSLSPVWSPDGRDIAYRNNRTGTWQVYARPADGSGPETPLTTGGPTIFPSAGHPTDGRWCSRACRRRRGTTSGRCRSMGITRRDHSCNRRAGIGGAVFSGRPVDRLHLGRVGRTPGLRDGLSHTGTSMADLNRGRRLRAMEPEGRGAVLLERPTDDGRGRHDGRELQRGKAATAVHGPTGLGVAGRTAFSLGPRRADPTGEGDQPDDRLVCAGFRRDAVTSIAKLAVRQGFEP